jgi:hypothetical protein
MTRRSINSLAAHGLALSAFGLLSTLCGCAGYQMGPQALYRDDIHTVYVPMIRSDSFRRDLGERLTEAVVKEIDNQSSYKVVSSDAADSILTIQIVNDRQRTIAENRNDDPRDMEVTITAKVAWVDRRGRLLGTQAAVPVPPLLLDVKQTAGFIAEGGQSSAVAHQQAIHRLARQIVSQMEKPW